MQSLMMTMLQCIFCEDWFHWRVCIVSSILTQSLLIFPIMSDYLFLVVVLSQHLWPRGREIRLVPLLTEELEQAEMVCARCVSEHRFVALYRRELGIRVVDVPEGTASPNKNQPAPDDSCNEPAAKSRKLELTTPEKSAASSQECSSSTVPKSATQEQADTASVAAPTHSADECKLNTLSTLPETWPEDSPAFFHDNWRERLCRCHRCLVLYSSTFLLILYFLLVSILHFRIALDFNLCHQKSVEFHIFE